MYVSTHRDAEVRKGQRYELSVRGNCFVKLVSEQNIQYCETDPFRGFKGCDKNYFCEFQISFAYLICSVCLFHGLQILNWNLLFIYLIQ